jgi:hypothetical protein
LNFPCVNAVFKFAPALAAGNTVVLKPSELASSSALRLAEPALEAGVPEGVLNVIPGLGSTVGAALALHPDATCCPLPARRSRAGKSWKCAGVPTANRCSWSVEVSRRMWSSATWMTWPKPSCSGSCGTEGRSARLAICGQRTRMRQRHRATRTDLIVRRNAERLIKSTDLFIQAGGRPRGVTRGIGIFARRVNPSQQFSRRQFIGFFTQLSRHGQGQAN